MAKKKTGTGIVIAAAVGAGLYLLLGKKANAAVPGTPPEPDPNQPGPGPGPTGPSSGGKKDAPPYPPKGMNAAGIDAAEAGAVNSVMAEHCDPGTGLCNKTTNDMTSQVWGLVYGNVKIPSGSRGSGWGDWIDAWDRIKERIEDLRPYGQTVFSGGKPVNAPKFPPNNLKLSETKALELATAQAAVFDNCDAAEHKCSKTIEQMASIAWNNMNGYKGVKIPPKEKQGDGWKPWIDAWYRVVNHVMTAAKGFDRP